MRWLIVLIPLGIGGCLIFRSQNPPPQAKAYLKDGQEVVGQVVEKEYGKFIVINTDRLNKQVITWDQLKYINEPKETWSSYLWTGFLNSLPQLAVAAGLFAFFNGLWQYRDAQKWKRAEFMVKEIDGYEQNQYVINAQAVLDSTGQSIDLPPKDASGVTPSMVVDSNTLTRVLSTPDPASPFSTAETRIRESFDTFLSSLEKFNNYIDSGLVKKKEIDIYLRYWLKIMGDKTNGKLTESARTKLWNYIKDNDYPGVAQLLKKFNYNI